MITEFVKEVKAGKIDPVENISKVITECKKLNKEYHYFNVINEDAVKDAKKINKKGRLAGLPISVKDCICVKEMESTAGSRVPGIAMPRGEPGCCQIVEESGGNTRFGRGKACGWA